MKKIILLLAMAAILTQVHAQELAAKDVPANVLGAFTKSNPSVKTVEWNKVGNNYVATFDADKKATAISYDALGMLIESRVEIEVSALPAAAMDYLKKNQLNDQVKKAYKVTR
jgi:hypothetical protein